MPGRINTWQSLWGSGRLAGLRGDLSQEEKLLRQALWLGQKEEGSENLELGILLLDLAECLEKQEKDEARDFYRQAQELLVSNAKRLGVIKKP